MKLRDYQAAAIQKIKDKYAAGVRTQLLKFATGLGKTPLFCSLPDQLGFTGRMLVLDHRTELTDQALAKLKHWNPTRTVGAEMGTRRSSGEQLVVAGVQTIGRSNSPRLTQFNPREFDCLVVDECFPAGTLVCGTPIERCEVGDYTLAFDELRGCTVHRKIVRVFKRKVGRLVRVTAGKFSVVCTPNHRFLTDVGWLSARHLKPYDNVRIYGDVFKLREQLSSINADTKVACTSGEGVLQRVVPNVGHEQEARLWQDEEEQPDEVGIVAQQDESHANGDWAQAGDEGRERDMALESAATACGLAGVADGSRCADEGQKGKRLSNLLQTGHSEPESTIRDRSRRAFPRLANKKETGPEEGSVPALVGVDSVEILEPGSDGTFGDLCSDGFVYNLEVETDHTYIANGFVVHNCHHATAQSYRTVIDHFSKNPKLLVLGVTATPNRADGTGLGEVFQEIVDDRDILFGIRNGWLAEMRGVRIKTGVNLSKVRNVAGDFDQSELSTTVNTPERNRIVVASWKEHAAGRQTVMFAVDVQHSKDLSDTFKRNGVAAEAIWGGDPDRTVKLEQHQQGKLKVLVNCQLLTEGYDDWRVSCIGDAAPTQSEGRYVQKVGRGTRIPDGIGNLLEARKNNVPIAKSDCIILDFVDSTSKHSLVTLPTLFGMGPNTDLRGKGISKIVAEIEEVRKRNPLLDLSRVDDVNKLQSYAEQVDLFKVTFPPEIIQLSEYQWHKTRETAYALALLNQEGVAVLPDILGKWHIRGTVNGYEVNDVRPTFEEAIKEADFKVGLLGGRSLKTLIRRESKWHKDSPTPAQLGLCKRMRIVVPSGATKGEVAQKLTQEFMRRKQRKVA